MKVDPDNINQVQERENEQSKNKGLFSKLFSKKDEDENPLSEMNEEIEDDIEKETEELERDKEQSNSTNLQATLEQIKAQINALGEFRKTTNERFLHLSEEIGQIRESVLTREKEASALTLKVSKAIDLVEQVHPEKLEELSHHQTTEMEKLSTKIESNRTMGEGILTQLKEVRSKMAIFNDVDDILKLNKEISDKLITIERIESVVDQHSSKIEHFFIKIEEQYQEFERFEHDRKEMESSHKALIKEFDKVKTSVSDIATIKDINKIEEDMNDINQINLESINVLKKQLAVLEESLDVVKQSDSQEQKELLEGTIKGLESKLSTLETHIEEHANKLEEHHRNIESHEEKLDKQNQHIININKYLPKFKVIGDSNKDFDKQLKQINFQVDNIKDSVKIHNQKIINHDKHIEHLHRKSGLVNNSRQPFGQPFDKLILQTHLALEAGSLKLAKKLYNKLRLEFMNFPEKLRSRELILVIRSIFEIISAERIESDRKENLKTTVHKHHKHHSNIKLKRKN